MSGLHFVSVTCPGGDLFPVSLNSRVLRSGKSKVKIICRQESQVQKQECSRWSFINLATLLANVIKYFFPLDGTSGTDLGGLTSKTPRNFDLSKSPRRKVSSIPNFWYCLRLSLDTLPTGDDLRGGAGARGGVCGPERSKSEVANDVGMVKRHIVIRHTSHSALFARNLQAESAYAYSPLISQLVSVNYNNQLLSGL